MHIHEIWPFVKSLFCVCLLWQWIKIKPDFYSLQAAALLLSWLKEQLGIWLQRTQNHLARSWLSVRLIHGVPLHVLLPQLHLQLLQQLEHVPEGGEEPGGSHLHRGAIWSLDSVNSSSNSVSGLQDEEWWFLLVKTEMSGHTETSETCSQDDHFNINILHDISNCLALTTDTAAARMIIKQWLIEYVTRSWSYLEPIQLQTEQWSVLAAGQLLHNWLLSILLSTLNTPHLKVTTLQFFCTQLFLQILQFNAW